MLTDDSGNASFDQTFAPNSPLNSYISATATNLTTNDTSEFSNAKQVLSPTAAPVSIGGRVLTADGRGVFGARVKMSDSDGNFRLAITNSFGRFSFAEVAAGETYIFTVSHKRYRFAAQIFSVVEDRDDLNFVAPGKFSTFRLFRLPNPDRENKLTFKSKVNFKSLKHHEVLIRAHSSRRRRFRGRSRRDAECRAESVV